MCLPVVAGAHRRMLKKVRFRPHPHPLPEFKEGRQKRRLCRDEACLVLNYTPDLKVYYTAPANMASSSAIPLKLSNVRSRNDQPRLRCPIRNSTL